MYLVYRIKHFILPVFEYISEHQYMHTNQFVVARLPRARRALALAARTLAAYARADRWISFES